MKSASIYQEDVAYIHHVGFGDYARRAGTELLRILKGAGILNGVMVDLACGSGIWAAKAQRAGFKVVGVDSSSAMIRLARATAPKTRFECRSLYEFELPSCDVITILGEGLNYLPPRGARRPSLHNFFKKAARALRPGGLLIFDAIVSDGALMQYRSWKEGSDWAVLFEVSEPSRGRLLMRHNIAFRKKASGWRRSEEAHRIRLLRSDDILKALRRAGFAARVSSRYGQFQLPLRRRALIARKL